LDANGSGKGSKIHVNTKKSGDDGQWWKFVHEGKEWGYFESKHGFVLDVCGGKRDKGTELWLWEKNGSDAQLWKVHESGDIQCKLGLFLDVAGGSKASGTKVHMWEKNGSAAQKWQLQSGAVWYHISAPEMNPGLVLESRPREQCHMQNKSAGDANQLWRIIQEGKGWGLIVNQAGLALDVKESGRSKGVEVRAWEINKSDAQMWKITPKFEIENKLGFVLDISGGSSAAGARVHQWDRNGTAAQRWTWTKA